MKKIEKSLNLFQQSDGSLSYDCNTHTDRFSFIGSEQSLKEGSAEQSEESKSFRAMFTEYMKRLSGVDENALSKEALLKYYLECGVGDIPHCVHQYVWQNYFYPLIWDSKKSQEAYLEGVKYLNALADEGKIPRENIPLGS